MSDQDAIGIPSLALKVKPSGIKGSAFAGSSGLSGGSGAGLMIILTVKPFGISSYFLAGSPTLSNTTSHTLQPTGIEPVGGLGSPAVQQNVLPAGIPGSFSASPGSLAAFGRAMVGFPIGAIGIASHEGFGSPTLSNISVYSISPSSIGTTERFSVGLKLNQTIKVPRIRTNSGGGVPRIVIQQDQTVAMSGLASHESFGRPSIPLPIELTLLDVHNITFSPNERLLDPVEMYAGNARVQKFVILDEIGDFPVDIRAFSARWALSKETAGEYNKRAIVTKAASVSSIEIAMVSILDAGLGYNVGEILTIAGGVGAPGAVKVLSASAEGAVAQVQLLNRGAYFTAPSADVGLQGESGSGLRLSLTIRDAIGTILVSIEKKDTEKLFGDFHQELEFVDEDGETVVVGAGDFAVLRNVVNV